MSFCFRKSPEKFMNKPFLISLILVFAGQLFFTPLQNAYTQSSENTPEQTAAATVNLNQVNDVYTTFKDIFGQFAVLLVESFCIIAKLTKKDFVGCVYIINLV